VTLRLLRFNASMPPVRGIVVLLLILSGCASSAPGGTTSRVTKTPRDAAAECLERRSGVLTIDADAMERFDEGKRIVFTGGVVACLSKSIQYADHLVVFLDDRQASIVRSVASGGVRVRTRDCLLATARRAVYDGGQLVLSGRVRVVDDGEVAHYERFVLDLSGARDADALPR